MKQKGFVNILLIIIVVALVGAGAYFVSTKQITTPNPTPSPTPKPSPTLKPSSTLTPSPVSNGEKIILNLPRPNTDCTIGDKDEINITDPNHPFVLDSKNELISLVGKEYVSQHYKFLCAVAEVPPSRLMARLEYPRVRWLYTVGDFSTDGILDEVTSSNGRIGHSVAGFYGPRTLKIEKVISSAKASEIIYSSIGDFTEPSIQIQWGNPEPSRMYLLARSTRPTGNLVDVARVNLETGELTKTKYCSVGESWQPCPLPQ